MDSIIAEKRIQATEIAWKIFCEKNFSEEWWLDNLYDNNKIDELFNLIIDYTQNKGISPHSLVKEFNVNSLTIEADSILKRDIAISSNLENQLDK